MPKDHSAEHIFTLFVAPDRAESLARELHNDCRARTFSGFWWRVISIALELGWKTLMSRPARAVAVLVVAYLLSVLVMHLSGYLWMQHPISRDFTVNYLWFEIFRLLNEGALPFLIGIFLAGLARGQEVTICVISALMLTGIYGCLRFYYVDIPLHKPLLSIGVSLASDGILRLVMFFSAAATVRSWRIMQGQSSNPVTNGL